ncbi:MAG: enoyl-CoA hydratase-related protein [Pseudomonadota bacterium]
MAVTGFESRRERGVSTITLKSAGGPVISLAHYLDLVDAMTGEALRHDVGAVLLTGGTGTFLFGMDINEIIRLETAEAVRGRTARVQDLLNQLEASRVPIVCAVDGVCYGGGLELVLACHVVFATPEASFALPEITHGTIPSFGGTQRLTRIIGRNRALQVMLSGKPFSARDAHDWGLVGRVSPSGEIMAEASKFCERIAALSRPAVSSLLAATLQGLDGPMERGLSLESARSSDLAGGADLQEGISAFFEKRRPKFPSAATS